MLIVPFFSRLPPSGELWGLFINTPEKRMDVWTKLMPAFTYDPIQPFFEILVPTVDTVRFGYVMQKLIEVNKPVLFTGGTGNYPENNFHFQKDKKKNSCRFYNICCK